MRRRGFDFNCIRAFNTHLLLIPILPNLFKGDICVRLYHNSIVAHWINRISTTSAAPGDDNWIEIKHPLHSLEEWNNLWCIQSEPMKVPDVVLPQSGTGCRRFQVQTPAPPAPAPSCVFVFVQCKNKELNPAKNCCNTNSAVARPESQFNTHSQRWRRAF